jgi:lysozyme family protein
VARTPPSLGTLKPEYQRLWDTMKIAPARLQTVDNAIAKLVLSKPRYEKAATASGVPWWWIAVVHQLEGSGRFGTHLHNGDPLTARTVNVPAGRPAKGKPPFTWEDSAADALAMKGLGKATDWTVPGALYQLERYNGWGYRLYHASTLSPYLWSFCQHYRRGKYVADGKWSSSAVSAQIGAAVLLKRMHERKLITFDAF